MRAASNVFGFLICCHLRTTELVSVLTAGRSFTIVIIQGGSNMTGTNCDLFTHNQSRSYLNHLVLSLTTLVLSACIQLPKKELNISFTIY
jgi:hypothetical protein